MAVVQTQRRRRGGCGRQRAREQASQHVAAHQQVRETERARVSVTQRALSDDRDTLAHRRQRCFHRFVAASVLARRVLGHDPTHLAHAANRQMPPRQRARNPGPCASRTAQNRCDHRQCHARNRSPRRTDRASPATDGPERGLRIADADTQSDQSSIGGTATAAASGIPGNVTGSRPQQTHPISDLMNRRLVLCASGKATMWQPQVTECECCDSGATECGLSTHSQRFWQKCPAVNVWVPATAAVR